MRIAFDKPRMGRAPAAFAVVCVALATVGLSAASCVTEPSKIVRTDRGRVSDSQGKIIAGAQVTVTSPTEDEVFQTKTGRDSSFRLAISPGKYLILRTPTTISGKVKDETGAPLKNSEIVLSKTSAIQLQPSYLSTKTDADGAFGFDESEPGEYRLLPSPSRAFAQPARLDCYERRGCNLEIILKANGTDRPYASCPVR